MSNLELTKQLAGSCNCLTKTNEPQYHDPLCYYRLLMEVAEVDELLKQIETLIDSEAYLIGAVDGYDYDSGVEYGLRKAAIIVKNARIDK